MEARKDSGVAALRRSRVCAVEMTPRGKRGKLKNKGEFSTLSTGLGNPAKTKDAGFPHFHRAGGGSIEREKAKT
jgi:hypothetical protein